ncbi:hypothetical protein J7M28_10760 [bacterium]|nr:hypothetical protein [bacterium]
MMKATMRGLALLLVLMSALGVAGCEPKWGTVRRPIYRGYLKLDLPKLKPGDGNGKQILIRSIRDNRNFQDNSPSPSTPSLGFGGVRRATEDTKRRAIARKRNHLDMALGEILLPEGQTVETVIYDVVSNDLRAEGYAVVQNEGEAEANAIVMDMAIDKFWGWFVPGPWMMALEAEVATTIRVQGLDKAIVLEASAATMCQMADTTNWRKLFRILLNNYANTAGEKLKNLSASHSR